MAKYEGGILAPVHGKVGSVVGSNWRAIDYVRSYTSQVKNPRTDKQQAQRGRLRDATAIARVLLPGAKAGLQRRCRHKSEFNELVRQIMGQLKAGQLELGKLVLSSGPRAGVVFEALGKPAAKGKYTVKFTSLPSSKHDQRDEDVVYVVYYDAKAKLGASGSGDRKSGTVEIDVPEKPEGDVWLYAYALSVEGVGSPTATLKL